MSHIIHIKLDFSLNNIQLKATEKAKPGVKLSNSTTVTFHHASFDTADKCVNIIPSCIYE